MFFREYIFESFDQGLVVRRAPTQPVTADLIRLQVHLGAHPAVHPQWVHRPTMSQHLDRALVIRAAQVNEGAVGTALQIQLPAFRKRSPTRRCW